jgi:hypothetical protein
MQFIVSCLIRPILKRGTVSREELKTMLHLTLPLTYLVSIPADNSDFRDILIVNITFKHDIIPVVLLI